MAITDTKHSRVQRYRHLYAANPTANTMATILADDMIDTSMYSFILAGKYGKKLQSQPQSQSQSQSQSQPKPKPQSRLQVEYNDVGLVEYNDVGLVVKETIWGALVCDDDKSAPVQEDGISFGFRQARDAQYSTWAVREGWDNPYKLCDRRFSNYPHMVVKGTNDAYKVLKRRIKAGSRGNGGDYGPLYLGAKLARDPTNPKAKEFLVRPGWDTEHYECERCYSEFPDIVVRGTNKAYGELEAAIKRKQDIKRRHSRARRGPTANTASNDMPQKRFNSWRKEFLEAEKVARKLSYQGGFQQRFEKARERLEIVYLKAVCLGAADNMPGLYHPYIAMSQHMKGFLEAKIESKCFGPTGYWEKGCQRDGGPPPSARDRANLSVYSRWSKKFLAMEKKYQALEKRGDGSMEEYRELWVESSTLCTQIQTVVKAVESAPLRGPYFMLNKMYQTTLKHKIEELASPPIPVAAAAIVDEGELPATDHGSSIPFASFVHIEDHEPMATPTIFRAPQPPSPTPITPVQQLAVQVLEPRANEDATADARPSEVSPKQPRELEDRRKETKEHKEEMEYNLAPQALTQGEEDTMNIADSSSQTSPTHAKTPQPPVKEAQAKTADPTKTYSNVLHHGHCGRIIVESKGIVFEQDLDKGNAGGTSKRLKFPWDRISKCVTSPSTHPKALLKIFAANTDATKMFQLASRSELTCLRDDIKKYIKPHDSEQAVGTDANGSKSNHKE